MIKNTRADNLISILFAMIYYCQWFSFSGPTSQLKN